MGKSASMVTASLTGHPNFRLPSIPSPADGLKRRDFALGAQWALQCAAEFISPPKEDGEDEEFSCEDVAEALRGKFFDKLNDVIMDRL